MFPDVRKRRANKKEKKQSPIVTDNMMFIASNLCEYGPGWRRMYREMVSILSPILQGPLTRLCAGYLSGGPSHLLPIDLNDSRDWVNLGVCDHCFRSVKKFQVFMQLVEEWHYLYQIVCADCLWPPNAIMSGVRHIGGRFRDVSWGEPISFDPDTLAPRNAATHLRFLCMSNASWASVLVENGAVIP